MACRYLSLNQDFFGKVVFEYGAYFLASYFAIGETCACKVSLAACPCQRMHSRQYTCVLQVSSLIYSPLGSSQLQQSSTVQTLRPSWML